MMSVIINTLLILPSEDVIKLQKRHSFTVCTLLPLPSDGELLTLNLHAHVYVHDTYTHTYTHILYVIYLRKGRKS